MNGKSRALRAGEYLVSATILIVSLCVIVAAGATAVQTRRQRART